MRVANRFFWLWVRLYQLSLSHLIGRSCRHYPTCSHYALWQLEKNALWPALGAITARVLRCNPLFKGGIDYPKLTRLPGPIAQKQTPVKIRWWYIPDASGRFLLIKRFKEK